MPNKAYIRIVAASVLFLGVCCLWGCYNKTYISFEEHSSHSTDSLTEFNMESKKIVSKAILKSGAVVTFNKAGGQRSQFHTQNRGAHPSAILEKNQNGDSLDRGLPSWIH